jgi:hypothetical protein
MSDDHVVFLQIRADQDQRGCASGSVLPQPPQLLSIMVSWEASAAAGVWLCLVQALDSGWNKTTNLGAVCPPSQARAEAV